MSEITDRDENISCALDIIQKEYDSALKRFYEWDSKLNMLFVFVASEIIALSSIYSNMSCKWGPILISVFIIISVLAIFFGMFSKKIAAIDVKHLEIETNYNETEFDFKYSYIKPYKECIDLLIKKSAIKNVCFTIAIISLMISLISLIIFMLI